MALATRLGEVTWLEPYPIVPDDRPGYLGSVCLGYHLLRARSGETVEDTVLIVTPPRGRPPARAAALLQKCDHMFSWISLASRSLL